MTLKTGNEYRKRIDNMKKNVWIDGKRLHGKVSRHPAFSGVVNSQAALYDWQNNPARKEKMSFLMPTTNERVSLSFLIPKTKEDLEKRRIMIQEWSQLHYGMLGRSPDYMNTAIMTFAAASQLFDRQKHKFAKNVLRYYEYCCEKDVTLTHSFVEPQVNRSSFFIENEKEPIAARIVDETEDGPVISGARLLATQGVTAEEIVVFPTGTKKLHPFPEDVYAYAFAIPNDTPGLTFVCRESFAEANEEWNAPLSSRFEEMDTIVLFDRVTVPWDRIFIYKDEKLSKQLYVESSFFEHCAHQTLCRTIIKTEFFLGVMQCLIDSICVGEYRHIHEKIAEVTVGLESLKGLLFRSEQEAKKDKWGTMTPAKEPLFAAVQFYPRFYPRMTEIIQQIGASGLVTIPTKADFHSKIGADLDRYLQSCRDRGFERVKLFRLAWDLTMSAFAARQIQYERFFFGDPVRLSTRLYRETDRSSYVQRIKDFLDS